MLIYTCRETRDALSLIRVHQIPMEKQHVGIKISLEGFKGPKTNILWAGFEI